MGCILYTLLIGKPPFETSCLKDTYAKIKKNEFTIPPNKISNQAKNLIQNLLQPDPNSRPTMGQILDDEFFHCGKYTYTISLFKFFSKKNFIIIKKKRLLSTQVADYLFVNATSF